MSEHTQDFTARKRFSTDDFECPLPPNVREELEELTKPRRPKILTRPEAPPVYGWVVPFALMAALLAVIVIAASFQHPATSVRATPRTPVALPSATPAATPTVRAPVPDWESGGMSDEDDARPGRSGVIRRSAPAPRAALVKLPPTVIRAELIALPQWPIGKVIRVMMPYGLRVSATYRGRLPNESYLPVSGNELGDMFVIGDTTSWLWLTMPGSVAPTWVDP
jgi:hypothetical protein